MAAQRRLVAGSCLRDKWPQGTLTGWKLSRWSMRTLILAAAASIALVGCGTDRAGECGPLTFDLENYLATVPYVPSPAVPPEARLATREDLKIHRNDEPIVFHISRGHLAATGETRTHLLSRTAPGGRAAVAIDDDVPWSVVVSRLRTDLAAFPEVVLLFDGAAPPKPPPSRADPDLDQLANLDAASSTVRLAEMLRRLASTCHALADKLDEMAVLRPAQRTAELMRSLPAMLRQCDCKTDVEALRSVVFRMVAVRPTTKASIVIARDGKRLELPPSIAWREANHLFKPDTTIWPALPGDDAIGDPE